MPILNAEDIGRVFHEANRALQTGLADPAVPISAPWDEESEHHRETTLTGVEEALDGATPEESHESWVRNKIAAGWTLGLVKDEERKEHPLLVPYAELSEQDRVKDALFIAVVNALRPLYEG